MNDVQETIWCEMGNKAVAKKEDLRERLIAAAEGLIAAGGLAGLKARDVTTAADCALGGLYTAFDDLDALILRVNSRTLARLGEALANACEGKVDPGARLGALAGGYVDFALANLRLWLALFDHRLPEAVMMPDWHRAEHEVLIAQIVAPLAQLRPDLGEAARLLRAKTMFAAVHGVVHLAMQGRFVGAPRDRLKSEVEALVATLVRGAGVAP